MWRTLARRRRPVEGNVGTAPPVTPTRPEDTEPGGHMAEKDSEGQQRANRRASETDEVVDDTATSDLKDRQEKLNDDVDSILDEIDEVLEENAEEFVRSYIQKGGQ
jgi:ubiquitin-like protein Pup